MESQVVDRNIAVALEMVAEGLDTLFVAGVEPVSAVDATTMVVELERLKRRVDAAQVALTDAIHQRCLHRADGHASAKSMIRHLAKLSPAEAAGRDKAARVCRGLPDVAAAYRTGDIGTDQVRLLGRIWANPRVRDHMAQRQQRFISDARTKRFIDFERDTRSWERIADHDGAPPATERPHRHRDVSLIQDHFDLGWKLRANGGAFDGASMREILDMYIQAEWHIDWEKAKAEHGDNACVAHLARTDAQRRFDALAQIFRDAAACPDGAVPPGYCHDVVWDAHTYMAMVSRIDPTTRSQPLDPDTYRCSTLNGVPLDPNEAIVRSLTDHIRRVVVDATGVVIDLSRKARLFTGSSRHAVKLNASTCIWPGCYVPTSMCEVDHLHESDKGGTTEPVNGAPLCGKHNRWKQKGFAIGRNTDGTYETRRPDGTRIE